MGPARYEKISVEAFAAAMERCLSEPSPRSARAVLRLSREQLLARPGGSFRSATPTLGLLVALCIGGSLWAFWGADPVAEKLRAAGMVGGFLAAALLIVAVLIQGHRLARTEHGDGDQILALARRAWSQLQQFEPNPDPIYRDLLRQLKDS